MGIKNDAKKIPTPTNNEFNTLVLNGLGISIISSSKGVISNKVAKKLNIGGELLCNVW